MEKYEFNIREERHGVICVEADSELYAYVLAVAEYDKGNIDWIDSNWEWID